MAKTTTGKRSHSKALDGQWISRDSSTGRVADAGGKHVASGKARTILKNSARRHSAALIRLADRWGACPGPRTRGGGRPGIANLSNIQGALGRPCHGHHRAISRKAAALLHGMATSHGFADGNKRTAWLVTLLLIEACGYALDPGGEDRIDDVAVAVVEGVMTEAELVAWFQARLARL